MAQDRTQYYQQLYDTDPVLNEAVERYRKYAADPSSWAAQFGETAAGPGVAAGSGPQAWFQATIKQRFKELGADDAGDYDYNLQTGEVTRAGFLGRNADWLIPTAATGLAAGPALAGGVGAGSAGGGSAASATTGTAGGTGVAGAGAAGAGTAGGVGGGVGAGGGVAAGGGILGNLATGTEVAGNLVPILTGMLASRQEGLQNDSRNAYNQGLLALQRNTANQNRFNTAQALPGQRLNTGLQASIAANWTPVNYEWGGPGSGVRGEPSGFTGGYTNPNLISPEARQLSNDVLAEMLEKQLRREQPPAVPEIDLAPIGAQGNALDSTLGGITTGLGIYGALGPLWRTRRNTVQLPGTTEWPPR